MADFEQSLRNQPVFLTGHTGFTGSWLTQWLTALDCDVAGYSLAPETTPNLFSILERSNRYTHQDIAAIEDHARVRKAIDAAQPSIVFSPRGATSRPPIVSRSPLELLRQMCWGQQTCLRPRDQWRA